VSTSNQSLRVAVVAGDQYHPAETVIDGLKQAAGPLVTMVDGPLDLSADVLVLAKLNVKSPTDPAPWTDDATDARVRDFVESGGGLLVIHAGTVGYQPAPAIHSMTGGAFIHHPEACAVTVRALGSHQITVGMADFTVHDEHYFVDYDQSGDVFLTSTSIHGEQPAGWAKTIGAGRVCVITPGHFEAVWRAADFQRLLSNALRWVANV